MKFDMVFENAQHEIYHLSIIYASNVLVIFFMLFYYYYYSWMACIEFLNLKIT